MSLASRRAGPRFGDSHILNALPHRISLPAGRIDLAVSRQQVRWLAKDPSMMVQAGAHLVCIGWGTRQHVIADDHAALDLLQPHNPPKLHRLTDYAFAAHPAMSVQHAA